MSLIFLFGSEILANPGISTAAKTEALSRSAYWLRLLHYKPSFPFGHLKSQVDGPEFFLSPDGKTNPAAELNADILGFSKDLKIGKLKQHAQCAFPERYRFLKKELGLNIKDVPCKELEENIKKFNPYSATLVFSSAYANNPSSMFGHTFLRINSKRGDGQKQEKMDLLDYGLNFSALVGEDENGVAFIWFGLTGGYQGLLSMVPYYTKVNEYVHSESRDLWEYDLNLSEEETLRLVRHTWEIATTSYMDYFFFDENCSYQLLTLLEVAKPDWNLSDFAIYVAPSESVKKLTNTPGAVTAIHFRPSLRKQMEAEYRHLSKSDQEIFSDVISAKVPPSTVESRPVLEAAMLYFRYSRAKSSEKIEDPNAILYKETLIQRSKLGQSDRIEADLPLEDLETRPDLGHGAYRFSFATGVQTQLKDQTQFPIFQEVGFKFAYHDLLNKDLGYSRFSQIDFPNATLRYYPADQHLNIEKIEAFSITSLFPMSFLEQRPSWKVSTDYYSPKDFNCAYCHALRTEAGVGAATELFSRSSLIYFFSSAYTEVSSNYARGYRFGPKAQAAVLLNPMDNFKMKLASNLITDLGQSERQGYYYLFEWEQSLALSQNTEIRSSLYSILKSSELGMNYLEGKATFNFYF